MSDHDKPLGFGISLRLRHRPPSTPHVTPAHDQADARGDHALACGTSTTARATSTHPWNTNRGALDTQSPLTILESTTLCPLTMPIQTSKMVGQPAVGNQNGHSADTWTALRTTQPSPDTCYGPPQKPQSPVLLTLVHLPRRHPSRAI